MTPRTKKAVLAILVTAVVTVLIIQLAVPPSNAQTVKVNNLPGTLVIGHTYTFFVSINLGNGVKILPTSIITLNLYKSSGTLVATASFNGTGSVISTGGFLQQPVVVYNGTTSNPYGYGGTNYLTYKVSIMFAGGGAVGSGQYSMSASLQQTTTSSPVTSAPAVFSIASSPSVFPWLPIFIGADLVVIAVVAWVIITMRRRR